MAAQSQMVIELEAVRTVKLDIEVTQADIDGGVPCDPRKCMIRVAMHRVLRAMRGQKNKHHYVVVQNGHSFWSFEGRRYRAPLPANALRALHRFDNGEAVSPFTAKFKAQDVGPVTKLSRARMDRVNQLRREHTLNGTKPKQYNLSHRLRGTAIPPPGRPKRGHA